MRLGLTIPFPSLNRPGTLGLAEDIGTTAGRQNDDVKTAKNQWMPAQPPAAAWDVRPAKNRIEFTAGHVNRPRASGKY